MLDNLWIRGRSGGRSGVVRGVVRVYFQLIFLFVFLVCSFFYLLLLFFAEIGISFLFIFSVVHSVSLLLKSDHSDRILFVIQSSAGRTIICSARDGLSRVYYICYADILYPSNEGNPLCFDGLLWPCCDPVVATFPQAVYQDSRKLFWLQTSTVSWVLEKFVVFLIFIFLISVLNLGAFIWLHWLQYQNFPPFVPLTNFLYLFAWSYKPLAS